MTDASFQTFMTGGILLLVAAIMAVGWLLWSMRDARVDAEDAALEGVTHELRLNLQRMLGEMMVLSEGAYSDGALMDIKHPQLDAVHGALVYCDRRALAVMDSTYQELQARKSHLRSALQAGRDGKAEREDATQAAIDGLVTLYLWDEHEGCTPPEARSTRSWDVREWMKQTGFGQFSLPGLHLRDAVVERLRQYGMALTPRPLTHTAYEYWSMRYDRSKDPRGVFGARHLEPDDGADHGGDAQGSHDEADGREGTMPLELGANGDVDRETLAG